MTSERIQDAHLLRSGSQRAVKPDAHEPAPKGRPIIARHFRGRIATLTKGARPTPERMRLAKERAEALSGEKNFFFAARLPHFSRRLHRQILRLRTSQLF